MKRLHRFLSPCCWQFEFCWVHPNKPLRDRAAWVGDCLLFSSLFCLALPDIVPDVKMLQADMKIQIIPLEYLRCPLEENCLSPSADFLIRYYSFNDLTVIVWMPVRLSIYRIWVIFERSLKNYTSLEASTIWKDFQISYAVLRTRVNLHRSTI